MRTEEIKSWAAHLNDRAIIEIGGADKIKFIQGLITNDIQKLSKQNPLIYTFMLSPTGRFLYDFFIFEKDDKLMIDCYLPRRDEIVKKLSFFKLRSNVDIKKNDALKVFHITHNEKIGFVDPRKSSFGYRLYSESEPNLKIANDSEYHLRRILFGLPESEHDLVYEKSIILEFGFEHMNAISFDKGCYIGQELMARTHYKGEIRKYIQILEINENANIEHGMEIKCDEKSIGTILSVAKSDKKVYCLSILRKPEDSREYESCVVNNSDKIKFI